MKFASLAASIPLVVSVIATAQDLTIKAPPQSGPIVIINAFVHPISSESFENGFIEFDRGVITNMGKGVWPAKSSDTQTVIDAKGAHVYPGMIAPWTQLGLTEIQAIRQSNDLSEQGGVNPEICPANAVNPDSTLIPVTRSNGILIAGVAAQGGTFRGQLGVIRLDGWTNSDMTINPFVGQVCAWPRMRTISAWWMDRSEDDQRRDISAQMESISNVFDVATRYRDARAGDPKSPMDLRWEAMIPVLSSGDGAERKTGDKPVFILADEVEQIGTAVAFAKKRGLKIVIVGGREADQCAQLLNENDIPVIITGTHVLPARDDAPYDTPFTLPKKLSDAGVTFAIENADDTAHERNLPYAAATAVAHGLSRDAAIRAITLDAVVVLGINGSYGSLEVGKSATLMMTTGDPLEVMTTVTSAFIDGRKIDLTNKQSELAEKYREKYRQSGELRHERRR